MLRGYHISPNSSVLAQDIGYTLSQDMGYTLQTHVLSSLQAERRGMALAMEGGHTRVPTLGVV